MKIVLNGIQHAGMKYQLFDKWNALLHPDPDELFIPFCVDNSSLVSNNVLYCVSERLATIKFVVVFKGRLIRQFSEAR